MREKERTNLVEQSALLMSPWGWLFRYYAQELFPVHFLE